MSHDELFTICGDFESLHCEFTRAFNLLKIFDEHLEESMEFLGTSEDGIAKYVAGRYDTLRSLLEVLEFRLSDATHDLRSKIYEAYDKCREEKANRKQT